MTDAGPSPTREPLGARRAEVPHSFDGTRPSTQISSPDSDGDGSVSDVVVVGGGIHGCALAYELSRSGLQVTLLERTAIAAGASGGPGMRGVRANDRDPRELPLMCRSYDLWDNLSDRLGRPSGYERIGGLELVDAATFADPDAMARIRAQVLIQAEHGIPSELVSGAELASLEPGIDLDRVAAAIHCPLDGVADQTQVTAAYAAAAVEHGARILEGATVTSLKPREDVDGPLGDDRNASRANAAAITSDGRVFYARTAVVLMLNTGVPQLLERCCNLRLPMWRWTPQVTMIKPTPGATLSRLVGHMTRPLSAKALPDGIIMLSGGRTGSWDEATDTGLVDETVPAENLADMAHVFPSMSDAAIIGVDASRSDSSCVDDIPVIDRVPHMPEVFFAAGWSGHGFAIAPAVAALLADWIRTGEPDPDLKPFGLARLLPSATHQPAQPHERSTGATPTYTASPSGTTTQPMETHHA